MIAFEIEDKNIEQTLRSYFKTADDMQHYLYGLIIEDLEEKKFAKILQESDSKEFVTKDDVFNALNEIA